MRLYEYEAKKIFKDEGIPIPKGYLVTFADEKKPEASPFPAVVKSQVLIGARGKSGGIKFVNTPEELQKTFGELFGKNIRGFEVKKILVEEKLNIKKEFYAGVTLNRATGKIAVIFSGHGGMEIEEVVKTSPEAVTTADIDILEGFDMTKLNIDKKINPEIVNALVKLYNIFIKYDAEIVEINPLVVTSDNKVVACDARMSIYDDAIPKQKNALPEILSREDDSLTPLEKEARKFGLGYIEMDGNVGVIGNGAGLNLTTLDILEYVGVKPANFLEVSGRTYDKAEKGLEIILKNPKVKAIFGNFFGCISRCDVIAEGIASAVKKGILPKNIPMIVAMRGNGGEEGLQTLRAVGLDVYEDDEPAAKRIAEILK